MHYAWPSRWLRNTYAFYLSISIKTTITQIAERPNGGRINIYNTLRFLRTFPPVKAGNMLGVGSRKDTLEI